MPYWLRMSLTCSSCSVIGTRECILSIHRADNYNHNSMETSLINTTKVLSCAFPERELESCYLAIKELQLCALCGTGRVVPSLPKSWRGSSSRAREPRGWVGWQSWETKPFSRRSRGWVRRPSTHRKTTSGQASLSRGRL